MMGEGLMKAEHVTGKGGSVIVDRRFAHGRPGAMAGKDVHPGAAREHLPARALEEGEERCLVEVAEGVALVRIDRQVDLLNRHGAKIPGQPCRCAEGARGSLFSLSSAELRGRD